MVVIAILILVAAFITPAMTSFSKSAGRKAVMGDLLGGIEQARTQALKDRRSTYVVFAAQPVGSTSSITDQTILGRYFYHSFAIFQDDPASAGNPKIQLTPWKVFATGVSLRSGISFAPWPYDIAFSFTPAQSNQNFPYLRFNANGEADVPGVVSGSISLGVFEGFVTGTSETTTNSANFTQTIAISPHTGRAEYIP
jgi:type II secretory pathway pseudopilin PulG